MIIQNIWKGDQINRTLVDIKQQYFCKSLVTQYISKEMKVFEVMNEDSAPSDSMEEYQMLDINIQGRSKLYNNMESKR